MTPAIRPNAKWPAHVLDLCVRLAAARTADTPGRATSAPAVAPRAEAWLALRDALVRLLRGSRLSGGVQMEDLEDLASEKALDLIVRAEQGQWMLEGRTVGEFVSYLSTVVRNTLVDHGKRSARTVPHDPDSGDGLDAAFARQPGTAADATVIANEFLASLRECVSRLQHRDRRVWFFRVFYEMPSREIAAHPRVALNASHVDVILQRARDSIRTCMHSKGFVAKDYPVGTFAELWKYLEGFSETPAGPALPEVE